MGKVEFVGRFVEAVAKTFGRRALTVFVLGAVVGLLLGGLSLFWVGAGITKWQMQERLDSANQRAMTAETSDAAATKSASQLRSDLQEQKGKYEEELSNLKTQLQDLRKRNAALQKQTPKRSTKTPILGDLYAEDEFYVMVHNSLSLIMDRRYSIVASPVNYLAALGNKCTLTVAHVDTDAEEKFEFVEGKSGYLYVGEAKVLLVLVSANAWRSRSNVCVFQQRQS